MEDTLKHYGIKGMKWGVRRYQNYDGSYTQRGLKRFRDAADKYDTAKANERTVRANRKQGTATKLQVKEATNARRAARRDVKKIYKRLPGDKRADQGKELYARGKTITGNTNFNKLAQVSILIGSQVANRYVSQKYNAFRGARISAAIAVGGTAVNAMLAGKTYTENRKLRAYYAHK